MKSLMRKDEIVRHVYHDYDCHIQNLMVRQLNRYSEQEFESFVKNQQECVLKL